MKELVTVIENPTGLHARPAKIFVSTAKQFKSNIRVLRDSKAANAKSLISMLTLGAERGTEIKIQVDGEDEAEAMAALQAILDDGLGEGELMARVAAAPAPAPVPAPPRGDKQSSATGQGGVPASPGIAIGPVFQFSRGSIQVADTFAGAAQEKSRLQVAIEQAREQLTALRGSIDGAGAAEAAIFDVHLEILADPELSDPVAAAIDRGQGCARAWQESVAGRAALLAGLDDPLLAARAADVRDVGDRVLRILSGTGDDAIELPDYAVIVVAHDLAPSDTAALDRSRVLGFCTAAGGPTAHTAILARALSIPAVVSAGDWVLKLANGTPLILDGSSGALTVDPAREQVARAQEAQAARQAAAGAALAAAAEPAVTRDGVRVEVVANVGGLADAQRAMTSGAEGIGLLRTEFLFLERADAPGDEEQFSVYRDIVQAMQGLPVIVRTLDIGGDKPLPYLTLPAEANPFLGERGIRLCLSRPELLRQQVRAILRAAAVGPLRIMFPMVSGLEEWRAARQIVEEVRAELQAPRVDLGIMIEIPSAALIAGAFAAEVDFFSIGSNDLTQYTLAMDRTHPLLAGKADGLHPAVLRLIAGTVEAAHRAGKWVGVCGELGSDPQAVPLLVGLGVDELSVSVPAIPLVKAQIRELTQEAAKALAQRALACGTAAEVRAVVANAEKVTNVTHAEDAA